MTTLKKIRAEIAKLRDSEQHGNTVTLYGWDSMKEKVLQIIDKYADQEPPENADLKEIFCMDCEYKEQEPCDDVVSRQAVIEICNEEWDSDLLVERIEQLPSVRPQEPKTENCRTCKYGEIYNDIWCKCHDPLLDGVMVKMTDQCRAKEIIDLNRKFKKERAKKEK